MKVKVYRGGEAELMASIGKVNICLVDDISSQVGRTLGVDDILSLTPRAFTVLHQFLSENTDLIDAYIGLSTCLRIGEMHTFEHLRPDHFNVLMIFGLLEQDEIDAYHKYRPKDEPEHSNAPLTHIYLMFDTRTAYTKIGRSKNPKARERTLQSDNPLIELLGSIEAPVTVEKELHRRYADKRIRGEWFDLSESDRAEILSISV